MIIFPDRHLCVRFDITIAVFVCIDAWSTQFRDYMIREQRRPVCTAPRKLAVATDCFRANGNDRHKQPTSA